MLVIYFSHLCKVYLWFVMNVNYRQHCCTRALDNPNSLLGVLREPRIIHILQLIQDQHGVVTTLQHLVQNNLHQSVEDL